MAGTLVFLATVPFHGLSVRKCWGGRELNSIEGDSCRVEGKALWQSVSDEEAAMARYWCSFHCQSLLCDLPDLQCHLLLSLYISLSANFPCLASSCRRTPYLRHCLHIGWGRDSSLQGRDFFFFLFFFFGLGEGEFRGERAYLILSLNFT